jgi:hypothetical protein
MRLITRGGYNWISRYSSMVEAALEGPPEAVRSGW